MRRCPAWSWSRRRRSRSEMLAWEKEMLGVYVSEHPFAGAAAALSQHVTAVCNEVTLELAGREVVLAGMVASTRNLLTREGKTFCAATIEDLSGSVEVTVWPDLYRADARPLGRRQHPHPPGAHPRARRAAAGQRPAGRDLPGRRAGQRALRDPGVDPARTGTRPAAEHSASRSGARRPDGRRDRITSGGCSSPCERRTTRRRTARGWPT